jgi:large subunit ribosomal protein L24
VHISKELAERLGIKARSIGIRRGDTVKVVSGGQKGKSGKVSKVNLRKGFVYIDGIVRKTSKGKEIMIPIRPSNLYITELDLSDKYRKALVDKMVSK